MKVQQGRENKREMMLTAPVDRLICKLAVPTIISMLVTSLYNLVDTYFVGVTGSTSGIGAVGVVFSLMAMIQACGFFF
ncbi:MAG: MATE family efflux transporter, partial [Eubacteriaceae bacterium]